MRPVRDESGTELLLVKQSDESSLVRDPETGEREYVQNDRLEPVEASALATAAGGVPDEVRRVLSAVHDDRSLGLLVELVERGPLAVRTLLAEYDLCESDLHGLLGEFRAAGLVEPREVGGQRGYAATDATERAVRALRDPDGE